MYETEEEDELALRMSDVVGGLDVEAYILTLKLVGEFDQPEVLAVIDVPATPVPDNVTDPPLGGDRGGETVAVLEDIAGVELPAAFTAVTRQRIGLR